MAQSITITRVSDNKKFIFYEGEVSNATYRLSSKRFNAEEPDGNGENNLSINLGATKTISYPIKLLSKDVDASDGTNTTPVKTIQEKLDYLIGVKDTDGVSFIIEPFISSGISDFYFIDIESTTGDIKNNKCQVDDFSIAFAGLNPSSLNGNMSFTIGGGRQ